MLNIGITGWNKVRVAVVAVVFNLACALAPAQDNPAPSLPDASLKAKPPSSSVSPISIWATPAAGLYGRAQGGGATLQMAMNRGWSAGIDISAAEEFCILCGHLPEKYMAGALLFGYRKAARPGFISLAAGPSWGRGEHRKPGAKPIDDPDCTWLCWPAPPEMIKDRGFGFRFQTDMAMASRHIGVGVQVHATYVPDHFYSGVAVIMPMGRIW